MRNFSARETEWLLELDGIELAGFGQRAIAFLVDWMIVGVLLSVVAIVIAMGVFATLHRQGKSLEEITQMVTANDDGKNVDIAVDHGTGSWHYRLDPEHSRVGEGIKIFSDVLVPGLYFGILLWTGKGRTPGKRLMKIRVVSLMHRHISFWHSVERALGYGAAALEGGFGFVQFFIHPYRRCAQDRLAETIVVTERGYQGMQHKLLHPLVPDTSATSNAPE